MKNYIYDVLIILTIFLFINGTQTYFHESLHSEICTKFGGHSLIEYSFLMQGGITQCTTEEGAGYHIINDIVSYTTSILIITIFMFIIFLTMILEKFKMSEKKRTIQLK